MNVTQIVYSSMSHTELIDTSKLDKFVTEQTAYAAAIGVQSPTIYAYEALGAALANETRFNHEWGGDPQTYIFSDGGNASGGSYYPFGDYDSGYSADFLYDAYEKVFGREPTEAQTTHFESQYTSLVDTYNAIYPFGNDAELIARGAVYGQMLGIRAESDVTFTGIPYDGDLIL